MGEVQALFLVNIYSWTPPPKLIFSAHNTPPTPLSVLFYAAKLRLG